MHIAMDCRHGSIGQNQWTDANQNFMIHISLLTDLMHDAGCHCPPPHVLSCQPPTKLSHIPAATVGEPGVWQVESQTVNQCTPTHSTTVL